MAEFKIPIKLPIEMQYRPCYVDGKKAIFHKWEKKKTPIIKFNSYYSDKQLAVEIEKVILDARTNIYFQESDYGIVEYEDGTVAEVEPSKIKFVTGIMEEYSYDDFSVEQRDYDYLKRKYDGLKKNHKMLIKRFNHLMESKYIRLFDEYDYENHCYKKDIAVADTLMKDYKKAFNNMTSCNDCAYNGHPVFAKRWKYCPENGEHVRYNCPYWKGIEE